MKNIRFPFTSLNAIKSFANTRTMSQFLIRPSDHVDILFAAGIMFILGVLIFPVAPIFLDILLSASIGLAVLILLTVLFIETPLEFSVYPSILLMVTILRLSLNISTTRLILANGHLGAQAAGHVVESFARFVIQGSVVIGAIIFAILTIINFVVITKGASRIAEVAARFNLDGMPGKQMAIDADLSSGAIDENEAKKRRKTVEEESIFYGAMDGANKFVRGDAVAGLLITFINFIGGIIIGVAKQDMSFSDACSTYTILTIGDGLVTQIPALIVSISAGLLVTKSGIKGTADQVIIQQLTRYPKAFGISATILIIFGLIIPAVPFFPFFFVGSLCGIIAYRVASSNGKSKVNLGLSDKASNLNKPHTQTGCDNDKAVNGENGEKNDAVLNELLRADVLRIELGCELLYMLSAEENYRIIEQIKTLRRQIAYDMGFIVPQVRIVDNMRIEPSDYNIKIKDAIVGSGAIVPHKLMIMSNKIDDAFKIDGIDKVDPIFGIKARWIDPRDKQRASELGYVAIDGSTTIITHLSEVIKENISELLTYGELQKMIAKLDHDMKKLLTEIVPSQISYVTIQRVFQDLLREMISIRDFPMIIEAISEVSATTQAVYKIVEHVRYRLSRQICSACMNSHGYIAAIALSSKWEDIFSENMSYSDDIVHVTISPSTLHEFTSAIANSMDKYMNSMDKKDSLPVILTSSKIRPYVRSVIERFRPSLVIISHNEVHPRAKIKIVNEI